MMFDPLASIEMILVFESNRRDAIFQMIGFESLPSNPGCPLPTAASASGRRNWARFLAHAACPQNRGPRKFMSCGINSVHVEAGIFIWCKLYFKKKVVLTQFTWIFPVGSLQNRYYTAVAQPHLRHNQRYQSSLGSPGNRAIAPKKKLIQPGRLLCVKIKALWVHLGEELVEVKWKFDIMNPDVRTHKLMIALHAHKKI